MSVALQPSYSNKLLDQEAAEGLQMSYKPAGVKLN